MKSGSRTLFSMLCITALAVLFCSHAAFAKSRLKGSVQNYLMWQMPGSNVPFPVYVYSGKVQVDYLYSSSQQAIIGPYNVDKTSGTYSLFYESDDGWHGCSVALLAGNIDISNTNCQGAVINRPVTNSNVYTLALAAKAWPLSAPPRGTPEKTDYGKRKITFVNKTPYSMIQIGEACTQVVNPNNPKCTNTQNLFQIKKGGSAFLMVDDATQEGSNFPAGLISASFYLSAYKNSAGQIISTGGYGPGQKPYATKIELTALPVTTSGGYQAPTGATNCDVSLVDGYNMGVTVYPQTGTYCTYTVPPESSNILGAGSYGPATSLFGFPVTAATSLPQLCQASSQLPAQYTGKDTKWSLSLMNGKNFLGCYSPCTYAGAKEEAGKDLFCCTGSYITPATCDQKPGQEGANTSTYVSKLQNTSKNMYRFAYDDAIGDFACPAETNLVVIFQ
ncbi:MAG: thaumatin family protein [Syntrophobacteraceae bacterium]|nr:thaumatin family protein [Syntrophobacteraceae bacterium]